MKPSGDVRTPSCQPRYAIRAVLMLCSLLIAANLQAQPAPRMGISPDRYQIVFDERGGETQSILVQNMSDEPLSLSLSVSNWALNDENQITVVPPTESSLDQWIVINPMRVTIPPGAPQTIRWAIMPRLKPVEGEYRAIIFIEEELPPREKVEGTEVRMKMRYGLPIYAHVGSTIESAQLNEIAVTRLGDKLNLDITNDGNIHARLSGNFGIWPSDEFPGTDAALKQLQSVNADNEQEMDFVVGNMPPSVILPGNRRVLNMPFPLHDETGNYTIQLNADFAQVEITETLSFTKHLPQDPDSDDPEVFRVATLPAEQPIIGAVE